MTALRRTVLVLDLLGILGCVALAVWSANDTSSSTSAIGVAVAIVFAIPLLVSGVLALVAGRLAGGGRTALTVVAAVLTLGLLGLLGAQLLLGS